MHTNPRLSGYVMMIMALALFRHIIETHRCLLISLAVVPSAESFVLIAINSMRGMWGRGEIWASNQGLFGAVFGVVWKLRVLTDSEIMGK